MARKTCKLIDGKWTWLNPDGTLCDAPEAKQGAFDTQAAYINGDTLDVGLKHPVTGETYYSKSAFRAKNKELGLVEVGNDLISKQKRVRPDKITEGLVMEKIRQAEAICFDSSRKREWDNRNLERYENYQKAMKGNN